MPPARVLGCVQRKKTLMVEYKSLRKANTFLDRRFGGEQGCRVGEREQRLGGAVLGVAGTSGARTHTF